MGWINKKGITGNIGLGLQFRSRLIWISYAQKITIGVVQRIIGGCSPTRRCDEKSHPIEANHIATDIALRLTKEGRAAAIFDECIADEHGPGLIGDDDGLKETSGNDVPFHTHVRFSGNVDPMVVVMNKIPDQYDLGIGKLHSRRLTAADRTVFDARVLDLLGEQHAVDRQSFEQHATAVEQADCMAAMVIDRHVADLDVRRAIGPFSHMQDSD